jgi:DNA-binding IscR family transcriptional regulator
MPGLLLTSAQASKLFGISPDMCADILARLVKEGMLSLNSDRRYSQHLALR